MLFTMNGKQIIVKDYTVADDGRLVFTFSGIAPQCMGDNIKAELICDDTVCSVKDGYSIKANVTSLLSKGVSDELETLIYDMLIYGAASQKYADYKTDELVTDGGEGLTASASIPEKSDTVLTESASADVSFKSAGVLFDYRNRIYVKFRASDISDVKVLFGESELVIEELGNGTYVAYSDHISAKNLSTVYTFTLKVVDATVQTLEYSVNSYAFAKYTQFDNSGNPTKMAELALALYRYGASAAEYSN